jgi:similar to stage IV sporulation protein
VGLGLSLCAVAFLSQFILTIQVTGNERVPTAVVLSQLRRSGVRVGVYGPGLDRKQIAQEALLELDDLAWMGINLHGTRLEVIVRETIEPPERVDEDDFFDIVAETDGVILRIEPELGDEMVEKNSVVAAGDILISGTVTMEPPIYSDLPARYYQVHARGRVWAKTWRTLTAAIPLEAEVKAYTGAEQNRWFVEILGRSIEIFGNSSFSGGKYDKITTVWQARLPNGTPLPLTLRRERQRAYETAQRTVDETAAREMLETRLSDRLTALLGDTGQAEETGFSTAAENGLLKVTLTARCQEEIGKEVPGTTPLSAQ